MATYLIKDGKWQPRLKKSKHMTSSHKPSVVIGIPAFNEEGNIAALLSSLLAQKRDGFTLEKIIVSSDGSEDNTVQKVQTFKNSLIKVIANSDRQGQGARQNQLVKLCRADILVLLNADMVIKDAKFLEKLIAPVASGQADLTSANFEPLPADGWFDRIIVAGLHYKKSVYDDFQNGNNWHTCWGAARAFSNRFYPQLNFKRSVSEDLYTYLLCKAQGRKYLFVKDTVIYGKLPTNFADHKRQSTRFFHSNEVMLQEFTPEFLHKNHVWPIKRFIVQGLKMMVSYPELTLYPLVVILVKVLALWDTETGKSDTWAVAQSTKSINL